MVSELQYYDDVDDIDYLETRQGSPDDVEDELDHLYDDDDEGEAFKDEVEQKNQLKPNWGFVMAPRTTLERLLSIRRQLSCGPGGNPD